MNHTTHPPPQARILATVIWTVCRRCGHGRFLSTRCACRRPLSRRACVLFGLTLGLGLGVGLGLWLG